MKGVIVQVGEPKSIVLFNNGKIGAIPTPADCHVGMVVSVKLNSKLKIIALSLAAVLLVALGIVIGTVVGEDPAPPVPPPLTFPMMPGGQGGHGSMMMERRKQVYTVSAAEALRLPDDTRVLLTGTIVESLGDEKYLFRDRSGDITLEIDKKLRRNADVDVSDTVEITGEVDAGKRRVVIDVKSLKKL